MWGRWNGSPVCVCASNITSWISAVCPVRKTQTFVAEHAPFTSSRPLPNSKSQASLLVLQNAIRYWIPLCKNHFFTNSFLATNFPSHAVYVITVGFSLLVNSVNLLSLRATSIKGCRPSAVGLGYSSGLLLYFSTYIRMVAPWDPVPDNRKTTRLPSVNLM